ncbi:hypothetical protein GGI13_002089 [Coemansia sp. RSA 455]|nr:hypothetical protein GGI13_002089 [Coemansia sp. RSA 455]
MVAVLICIVVLGYRRRSHNHRALGLPCGAIHQTRQRQVGASRPEVPSALGNVLRECELDSVSQLVEPGASAVPDRCAICLEAMTLGFRDDARGVSSSSNALLRVLRCEHRFHAQCVDPYPRWENFEDDLRSKQNVDRLSIKQLDPATEIQGMPLVRPTRPIPRALLSYSPMDNLSLLQMTSFLGECDCTPRDNVEPAKRPASESEGELVPVAPLTKRSKTAHTPPPVWSERFAYSKSVTTNSSSAGSSRSSTPSTPKHVVQDKTPTHAIRPHQRFRLYCDDPKAPPHSFSNNYANAFHSASANTTATAANAASKHDILSRGNRVTAVSRINTVTTPPYDSSLTSTSCDSSSASASAATTFYCASQGCHSSSSTFCQFKAWSPVAKANALATTACY